MLQPVLLILHQEHSSPGRVGQRLAARGYPLDIRRPRFGDDLPETMDEHAGAVIFGGPQSANDEDDFVKRETDWIGVPLRDNKPYLGICLGAQMMARHLGARVYPHPDGHAEVGYYPIRPTDAGLTVCPDWPDQVYQWHREGFDLPSGSELLAEGDAFSVQSFRHGSGYAVQFHPEVTHAMMYRWLVRGAHRMDMPGTKQRHEHIADRAVHDRFVMAWLDSFLNHWLGRAGTEGAT
ncbi:MAG: glutamine amidotransferase [Xanthobacteraceae bacterium]|uniref:glutamine amidotransferase n=1 Tax=Pseudolabrys sp. TaxID=1960880 RepID=UPI003D0AE637